MGIEEIKQKFLSDLKINPDIKEVNSEEEYWIRHKEYNKKLKSLTKDYKKMINFPDEYINEVENCFGEMVAYGVVDLDFVNEHRMKIYKELSNPREFLEWVKDRKIVKKFNKLKKK